MTARSLQRIARVLEKRQLKTYFRIKVASTLLLT